MSTIVVGASMEACSADPSGSDGTLSGDAGTDARTPRNDGGEETDAGTHARESFSVGGTVSGLTGTGLVLQNDGGDDLAVAADGSFAFSKKVESGKSYAITVKTQPSTPAQTCVVSGGTGTVAKGNVTTVTVDCESNKYTVGGTSSGVAGTGLVLQNNAGDDLVVTANGTFSFATTAIDGADYAVTIKSQPTNPSQTCVLTDASGRIRAANVTNIGLVCTTNTYDIGGSVTGLTGSGLVLKDNGGDDLSIAMDGTFKFPQKVASGSTFKVTVGTQPTNPSQTCTVTGDSGTVVADAVTSVVVNCKTDAYTVGGNATGVAGQGLVLQNNGADDLSVTAEGAFAFGTAVDNGQPYAVTVKSQPTTPSQTCVVTSGSGTMGLANVTNVGVACTTNTYKIKGKLTGLVGTGLVLQDNAGDDLPVSSSGDFVFNTPVASGATYAVTVKTQPTGPSQSCTVTGGTGTVGGGDVTNVTVACVTNSFTVGGSVSGLAGSGLVLQNNLGDNLSVTASGSFTFPTKLLSGASYSVTVKTQPSSPTQTCTVSAGTGTVTNGNVATVAINCSTNAYTVGGNASGLAGTGLVLQNNLGDDLTVNANGSFAFGTAIKSGLTYSVTVKTQPTNPSQTCAVTAGSGTVGGANVTNVGVACTTNKYSVGGTASGVDVAGLVLRNNGGDDLNVGTSGTFTFATPIASNGVYAVTVKTQPAGRYCTVTNGSGTVTASAVTNVTINCVHATVYGPSHSFAGLTGTHFITQGACSPTGNIASDATYFCQHFYNDTACAAQSYVAGQTSTSADVKLHNRDGCTSYGNDIQGTTCNGGPCKIGDWNESTSGINNLVCVCPN